MTRLLRGSLVLAVVGGIAAADSTPPPVPTAAGGTASASGAAPAPRRSREHFFVGEVVEIVAPERRFSVRETLRDGSPKVTFFTVDPATSVLRGKEAAAFADLRVNDHVTIKYTETDKTRRTVSIRITPSKPPKPAAATATAKPPA
jgi:hypothetical protein